MRIVRSDIIVANPYMYYIIYGAYMYSCVPVVIIIS